MGEYFYVLWNKYSGKGRGLSFADLERSEIACLVTRGRIHLQCRGVMD